MKQLPMVSWGCAHSATQRGRAVPAEHMAAALGEHARDGGADAGGHAGDDHHAIGVDDDAHAGPRLVVILRALPARQQPVLLLLSCSAHACAQSTSSAYGFTLHVRRAAFGRAWTVQAQRMSTVSPSPRRHTRLQARLQTMVHLNCLLVSCS